MRHLSIAGAIIFGVALVGMAYFLLRTKSGAKVKSALTPKTKVMGPPPPAPPPTDRADGGQGVIDQAVAFWDNTSEQVGYELCMKKVGNKSVCDQAKVLKYANPITATVHVAQKAYEEISSWF